MEEDSAPESVVCKVVEIDVKSVMLEFGVQSYESQVTEAVPSTLDYAPAVSPVFPTVTEP